jgi:hypothetical protein
MKKVLTAVILMTMFISLSYVRTGQGGDEVCEDAANRYCWNVEPGHDRVWQCLRRYQASLNAACWRRVQAHTGSIGQADDIEKACKSDRKKHCRYVEWTDSRLRTCLKIHEVQLSERCHAVLFP